MRIELKVTGRITDENSCKSLDTLFTFYHDVQLFEFKYKFSKNSFTYIISDTVFAFFFCQYKRNCFEKFLNCFQINKEKLFKISYKIFVLIFRKDNFFFTISRKYYLKST